MPKVAIFINIFFSFVILFPFLLSSGNSSHQFQNSIFIEIYLENAIFKKIEFILPTPFFTSSPHTNYKRDSIMGYDGKILRNPRFLCPYGFHTSVEILKKQVGKCLTSVLDQLDLDFSILNFLPNENSTLKEFLSSQF